MLQKKKLTCPIALLLFLILGFTANATTYYVSNSGNDSNSGTDASSPWQTLNKLNSFRSFAPGDNILFRRGDTFYGSITVSNSGSGGNPITYGAYGSGANPIITGFTKVTSWTNIGGNLWESSSAVSSLSYANIVTVNGVNTGMGRYPNTGFLTYQSHSGNTSITSNSLNGSPNWTGADVAVKANRFTIDRAKITSQSGGTLSFAAIESTPTNNYGFFIENDPRTLDVQNEWFYNPSTKKLRIYSSGTPSNIQVSSIDKVINIPGSASNIIFNNLTIQGANNFLIFNKYGNNLTIINCTLSYCGDAGMQLAGNYHNISNNTITDCSSSGIFLNYGDPGGHIVKNNTIKRTNLIMGVIENDYSGGAIWCTSANTLIQYNNIDSSGYCGINFKHDNVEVRNNLVNNSCLLKADGGGIYTGFPNESGKIIDGNIVLNTVGSCEGTNVPSDYTLAQGIFIDDNGVNISVTNNTVANGSNSGIKIHNARNITVKNNTLYNNGKGTTSSSKGQIELQNNNLSLTQIRNIVLENNIFFSRTSDQLTYLYSSILDLADIELFGSSDYNYYSRPLNDDNSINILSSDNGWPGNFYNVTTWHAFTGQDANSKASPKAIKSVDELRFEYNASTSSKTIALDAKYIDVTGKTYNGTITLAPYSSVVLIKDGAITEQIASDLLPAVNPSNTVNGLDYKYYEASSYSSLPSFDALTPVKTGTIGNFDISPANRATRFSFNFTGYINVPADGQYTFYTTSDDGSELYIDGILVVNNDGIQAATEKSGTVGLKAGKHAISVGYFQQDGDKVLSLSYAGPGINKQNIPASALYRVSQSNLLPAVNPLNIENGLKYKYYEADSYSSLPSFDDLKPVKTGTVADFYIFPANRATRFSFNFTGYIDVPADGQYTFYTTSDDGSELYIDGILVVNNDGIQAATEKSGTVGLKAGKHAISVGYFQQDGDKVLSLSYAGPGINKQKIPPLNLYRDQALQSDLLPAVNPSNIENGLKYKYYEADSYSSLPSFDDLKPVKTGTVADFYIFPANRATRFSFNFTGYIDVPADGQYTFYTTSDDGSELYIDGILVVNNDGIQAATERSGTIGLMAGKHTISVGYFQQDGDKVLSLSYAGPGINKQKIPPLNLYRDQASFQSRMAVMETNTTGTNDNAEAITNEHGNTQLEVGITAYPNPFTNSIVVSITGESGIYNLLLVDALGRTMWTRSGAKDTGTYQESINTSSIERGIYFLKVIQNNKTAVIKLKK